MCTQDIYVGEFSFAYEDDRFGINESPNHVYKHWYCPTNNSLKDHNNHEYTIEVCERQLKSSFFPFIQAYKAWISSQAKPYKRNLIIKLVPKNV